MVKNQKGFTIVELLIVIVVIAILAAITAIAFNGVTVRAKFAQKQADISTLKKGMQVYNLTTSSTYALHSENGLTLQQNNALLSDMGLGAFRDKVVYDSANPLNNTSCTQSPMTKDKFCIAAGSGSGVQTLNVTYWHDTERVWKSSVINLQGGSFDTDVGTGAYPEGQVY